MLWEFLRIKFLLQQMDQVASSLICVSGKAHRGKQTNISLSSCFTILVEYSSWTSADFAKENISKANYLFCINACLFCSHKPFIHKLPIVILKIQVLLLQISVKEQTGNQLCFSHLVAFSWAEVELQSVLHVQLAIASSCLSSAQPFPPVLNQLSRGQLQQLSVTDRSQQMEKCQFWMAGNWGLMNSFTKTMTRSSVTWKNWKCNLHITADKQLLQGCTGEPQRSWGKRALRLQPSASLHCTKKTKADRFTDILLVLWSTTNLGKNMVNKYMQKELRTNKPTTLILLNWVTDLTYL